MTQISAPTPVKLFIVTLHRESDVYDRALGRLKPLWGEADFISESFPFDETHYYEQEMGTPLERRFISFERLISPDQIVDVKLQTNLLEQHFARDASRTINLDPGYLDHYKVVLASAKFGGQKIYMRDGIYADMTLVMYKGKWESFAWGFPDFKSGKYDRVLSKIRDLYKAQLSLRPS